jgi:TRAP-type uncharacterized transport system fused permease subunit
MVMALLLCIPLIEAVRRTTGWTLPVIVGAMVAMTLFQNVMPGILYGRGYDPDRLLYSAYVGEAGIFGLPLNVASNIILIFLLFGALMEVGGAGDWFLKLALSLTGRSRGGPAKAAVVASAMFGSISGSPSANRLTPMRIITACGIAVRSWVTIVAITAFVGIMIGALELSGVGIKISNFIIDLSGGNLLLTMAMVALACFILGMGLDSIPVWALR